MDLIFDSQPLLNYLLLRLANNASSEAYGNETSLLYSPTSSSSDSSSNVVLTVFLVLFGCTCFVLLVTIGVISVRKAFYYYKSRTTYEVETSGLELEDFEDENGKNI